MKRFVRFLACALCLTLTFSALPRPTVQAKNAHDSGSDAEWALEDGVLWISCRGEMDFGKEMPWSKSAHEITSVRLDEGITGIAEDAFRDCGNLQSVSLPQSLRYIHDGAFQNCENICWITFPENTVLIGEDAFRGCRQLSTVFIPESVSYIGDNAFEPTIFMNGLSGSAAEDYIKENGGSFKQLAIHELASASGNCGKGITWTLEKGRMSLEGSGAIAPEADGYYPWEHLRADIVSVEIGEGITGIHEGAFENCRKLAEVTIPASVTEIDSDAFEEVLIFGNSGSAAEAFAKEENLMFTALTAEEDIASPEEPEEASPVEEPEKAAPVEEAEETALVEEPEEAAPVEEAEGTAPVEKTEEAAPVGEPEEDLAEPESEAEAPEPEDGEKTAASTLTVGQVGALAGQQVAVPILLEGNPGICGLNFRIDYDRAKMTLTDFACSCDGVSAGDWTVGIGEGEKALWFQPDAGIVNGEILTLYFTVQDNAREGEIPVTLTELMALNAEEEPVELEILSGCVTVREGLKGDVNGDGLVTAADVLRLRRYLAGQNVVVEAANADLNGDGKTDLTDLLLLSKSVAGV